MFGPLKKLFLWLFPVALDDSVAKERYPDAYRHAERLLGRMLSVCKKELLFDVIVKGKFIDRNGILVFVATLFEKEDYELRADKIRISLCPWIEPEFATATLVWCQGNELPPSLKFKSHLFSGDKKHEIEALLSPDESNDSTQRFY